MADNIRDLLPKDKHDCASVDKIIAVGYPGIESILYDLLFEWMEDINISVAWSTQLIPFLRTIGISLAPHIRKIFELDNWWLQYNILNCIINNNPELTNELMEMLENMFIKPVDIMILDSIDLKNSIFQCIIQNKTDFSDEFNEMLDKILNVLVEEISLDEYREIYKKNYPNPLYPDLDQDKLILAQKHYNSTYKMLVN